MNGDEGSSLTGEDDVDLTALLRVVEEMRADLDSVSGLADELQLAMASGLRPNFPGKRIYPDWQAWVDDWLVVRISRSPQRFRWCRHYVEHPEVADRLEALWHTWEVAWPDPLSRLPWFRDGLDHHLAVISAEDGPLRSCSSRDDVHTPDERGA